MVVCRLRCRCEHKSATATPPQLEAAAKRLSPTLSPSGPYQTSRGIKSNGSDVALPEDWLLLVLLGRLPH